MWSRAFKYPFPLDSILKERMEALAYSLAIFIVMVILVLIAAVRSPSFFRLGLSFFMKKRRLSALTIAGLVVGSAMTTGSLAVGDSMKQGVLDEVYANLGAVDEVVHSSGLFNESIFDVVAADMTLSGLLDALAPLMILKGSVKNSVSGAFESNVNIIGYTSDLLQFGAFTRPDGGSYGGVPARDEVILNEMLAGKIGVREGGSVTLLTRNPEFSIEGLFSPHAQQITVAASALAIVGDKGLGRFNLESGRGVAENVYVELGYLQEKVRAPAMINTIVLSNNGDDKDGVELTTGVMQEIGRVLDGAVGYADVKLDMDAMNYLRIESQNVFLDERYRETVESMVGSVAGMENVSSLTSYFVNNISFNGVRIAYSTVTGLNPYADSAFGLFIDNATKAGIVGDIGDDGIILTNYTAARLGAKVNDTVTLNYTVYVGAFTQTYRTAAFTVKHVVDMAGKASDPNLMPPFPGIRGKASCGDWDAPWLSLEEIRRDMEVEDLNYWVTHGGTPKAYIALNKAQELWSNDLGNITTIKVKGPSPSQLVSEIGDRLNVTIMAGDAGITVSPVKLDGIDSAEGVQLLTETFLSFGAVVIISGIILAVALVGMVMEGRRKEIGVLKTIGANRRQVTLTFAFEAFFLSLTAAAIGVLAGILVAFACIGLTNAFWSNIVEGTPVSLYFTPDTIAVGFVAGFLISFVSFVLSAHWVSGSLLAGALRDAETRQPRRSGTGAAFALGMLGCVLIVAAVFTGIGEPAYSLALVGGIAAIALSVPFVRANLRSRERLLRMNALVAVFFIVAIDFIAASNADAVPFILYFASGFAIIACMVAGMAADLRHVSALIIGLAGRLGIGLGTLKVSFLSPARRVRRTALTVSLFAVVVFTYVGMSVNIQGQQLYLSDMVKHQGAGYDVYAESSISLRFDLGNETERVKNGVLNFPPSSQVVQFLTFGQLGGSCSNLKRNLPPRLIAANGTFTQDSLLRFQATSGSTQDPWAELEGTRPDGSIPAIGDSNTVIWILGKNVGDHIQVVDENGGQRQLVIVGITENSIFPGSVFISEDNMNRIYTTTAEYRLFLFKTGNSPAMVSYLETHLQAYGMDASTVDDVVRSNLSVEWSYMGLFQALLLLGLVVGILGLAASSSRTVVERKSEIGTMRALGFDRSMVLKSLVLENLYVASIGVLIGIVSGLLMSFTLFGRGTLTSYSVAIPWLAMIVVIAVVDLTAFLAVITPARHAAAMKPVEALRKDQ